MKNKKNVIQKQVQLKDEQIESIYAQSVYDFINSELNTDLIDRLEINKDSTCGCPECTTEILEAVVNDNEALFRYMGYLVAQLAMLVFDGELDDQTNN